MLLPLKALRSLPLEFVDPSTCPHERSCRLGIQRFPFPPYRVYLLRCLACETTLTTGSIRESREGRSTPSSSGGPEAT